MNISILFFLSGFFAISSYGAVMIGNFSGTSTTGTGNPLRGNTFVVGDADILVTHLGYADTDGSGTNLNGTHEILIWKTISATQDTAVVRKTVAVDSPYLDGFRYVELTGEEQVVLEANAQYLIGAVTVGNTDTFYRSLDTATFDIGTGLSSVDTVNSQRYSTNSFDEYPDSTFSNAYQLTASFQYTTAVPEPSEIGLALSAMIMFTLVFIRSRHSLNYNTVLEGPVPVPQMRGSHAPTTGSS